jgi:hypothetical protein
MVWPEKVQKKDISWLPREQTLSMRNHFEEEEEELSQVLLMGSGADCFFISIAITITITMIQSEFRHEAAGGRRHAALSALCLKGYFDDA